MHTVVGLGHTRTTAPLHAKPRQVHGRRPIGKLRASPQDSDDMPSSQSTPDTSSSYPWKNAVLLPSGEILAIRPPTPRAELWPSYQFSREDALRLQLTVRGGLWSRRGDTSSHCMHGSS
jgi:hypothetical protein